MSNPQIEDGYTRIANELLEEICKKDFNGLQMRVLFLFIRQSYGFQRKAAPLSADYIQKQIGTGKRYAQKIVKSLIDGKILGVEKEASFSNPRILILNKNWEEWDVIRPQRDDRDAEVQSGRTTEVQSGRTTEVQSDIHKRKIKEKNKERYIVEQSTTSYPYLEIIGYLNHKTGKAFRWQSKATQKHIHARCEEGYSLEDFKGVIDFKVMEWMGNKMEQYLRPETLFGPKFEGYLNQAQGLIKKESVKATDSDPMERFCNLSEEIFHAYRQQGIISDDGGVCCGLATKEQIRILQEAGAL